MKEFNLLKQSAAQILSQGTYRIFQISIIWWINTHSHPRFGVGTLLAFFLVASALPSVLFAKVIGKYIDRENPIKSMKISTGINSVVLLGAAVLSHYGLFSHTVAVALGASLALMQALFDPSVQKNIGLIVKPDKVDSAVHIITTIQSIVSFAGAVAGSFLINSFSLTVIFLSTMALYFVSSFLIYTIRTADKDQDGFSSILNADPNAAKPVHKNLGLKFKWDSTVFKMVIGFGFINFFLSPIVIVLPLYVQNILNGTAIDLGLLEASISIGLIFGMLLGKKISQSYSVLSTAALAMAITGTALIIPGFLVHRSIYLFFLFIAGFAVGCNNIRVISYFQSVIAQENKGLFFSYLQATVSFAIPLGYLAFGLSGDFFSPKTLCIIQGFGILILSVYFQIIRKSDRATV